MILFIKHIDIEGPETLGEFFNKLNFPAKILDLSKGDPLPGNFIGLDAVVSLGGPMNVYEEEKFPFLVQENIFIQGLLEKEIPFLGICFGSQLLAKACGAQVGRSLVREIGFSSVKLTEEGKKDPLFEGVADEMNVFQWHEDTFEIPANGQWLVSGEACPHQAFKVGTCAYGFQFHVEITEKTISEWVDVYLKDDSQCQQTKDQMLADYTKHKENLQAQVEKVYNNFLKIVQAP